MNPTTPEPTTNTAEPSTFNLEPPTNSPELVPCNESSEPSTCNLQLATLLAYRGNGKVARFPKPVRDQINHWLLDGVSYPDIIQRLGDQGKDLKPDNLSQWKKRGHQDWLLEQAWLEETRTRQEPASDLSADFDDLWLRGLFTCRTEDWHFLKTVLFHFLEHLPHLQAAGDESGLGRQICWEAAEQHAGRFVKVNFGSKKHDLGFTIMNQLSVAEKHFPRSDADVAADYFALRKTHNGTRWAFSEGRNALNAASHCDIAWAGALATHAHLETPSCTGCLVAYDHFDGVNASNASAFKKLSPEQRMMWSNDPRIWGRSLF